MSDDGSCAAFNLYGCTPRGLFCLCFFLSFCVCLPAVAAWIRQDARNLEVRGLWRLPQGLLVIPAEASHRVLVGKGEELPPNTIRWEAYEDRIEGEGPLPAVGSLSGVGRDPSSAQRYSSLPRQRAPPEASSPLPGVDFAFLVDALTLCRLAPQAEREIVGFHRKGGGCAAFSSVFYTAREKGEENWEKRRRRSEAKQANFLSPAAELEEAGATAQCECKTEYEYETSPPRVLDRRFADVRLLCQGGREVLAFKALLARGSEFFRVLFTQDEWNNKRSEGDPPQVRLPPQAGGVSLRDSSSFCMPSSFCMLAASGRRPRALSIHGCARRRSVHRSGSFLHPRESLLRALLRGAAQRNHPRPLRLSGRVAHPGLRLRRVLPPRRTQEGAAGNGGAFSERRHVLPRVRPPPERRTERKRGRRRERPLPFERMWLSASADSRTPFWKASKKCFAWQRTISCTTCRSSY